MHIFADAMRDRTEALETCCSVACGNCCV